MKEKIDQFNQSEELRDIAIKRMLGKMTIEGEKQERFEDGIEVGKKEGMKEGTVNSLCTYVQSRFNENIKPLLKDLPIEKIIQIQSALYTASTIEEIKQLLTK